MKKKKIVFHSNCSRAFTGFGKNAKNILKYLYKTNKYELVEFCNGKAYKDKDLETLPWKTYGSLPMDQNKIRQINEDPGLARRAAYGSEMVDQIIADEKPDIYLGVEDIWGFDGYWNKKWWNKTNCMIWTTLDSLPILPKAVDAAKKIKNYYVWASFAEKGLNDLGHNHVKTLRGSIDTSTFYPLPQEQKSLNREKYNIDKDEYIIGFVFRNQLRKSVPNLLDGFKLFKQQNPNTKAKLLLHTHWSEGWDIVRLLKEKNIDRNDILTTYFCKHCKNYEIKPFSGQNIDCKLCGSVKTQETTNVSNGVDEEQLNEIYNLMDVYCHPFTSGGQEIPIQEAKLTELITLVTNYSCGEDSCNEESAGLPLEWTEYREPGTQFIKATTSPESIAERLTEVYNIPNDKRLVLGRQAREYVIKNYSIEVIGKQLEDIFDNMPEVDWDFDLSEKLRNVDYLPQSTNSASDFIIDLYKNMLNVSVDEDDEGFHHWMQKIQEGAKPEEVIAYFRQVAQKENAEKVQKREFTDLLNKDDEGKRIIYVMPKSVDDVYLSTALFKNIKETYPEYNLYIATDPKYFEIMDGNRYVHKVIPYIDVMDNLLWLEGIGDHQGYFEIAFLPFFGTQRMFDYQHNGKDKISLDLCTF